MLRSRRSNRTSSSRKTTTVRPVKASVSPEVSGLTKGMGLKAWSAPATRKTAIHRHREVGLSAAVSCLQWAWGDYRRDQREQWTGIRDQRPRSRAIVIHRMLSQHDVWRNQQPVSSVEPDDSEKRMGTAEKPGRDKRAKHARGRSEKSVLGGWKGGERYRFRRVFNL